MYMYAGVFRAALSFPGSRPDPHGFLSVQIRLFAVLLLPEYLLADWFRARQSFLYTAEEQHYYLCREYPEEHAQRIHR